MSSLALAQVRSAVGSIVATVTVDDGMARGHVSVPHGYDPAVGPAVSTLISSADAVDPLTGMVRQSGVPVELVLETKVDLADAQIENGR